MDAPPTCRPGLPAGMRITQRNAEETNGLGCSHGVLAAADGRSYSGVSEFVRRELMQRMPGMEDELKKVKFQKRPMPSESTRVFK